MDADKVIARLRLAATTIGAVCDLHAQGAPDTAQLVYLIDAERIVREEWPAARECVYTEDKYVWVCSACDWMVALVEDSPKDAEWAYCPHCGARIAESRAYVEDDDDDTE